MLLGRVSRVRFPVLALCTFPVLFPVAHLPTADVISMDPENSYHSLEVSGILGLKVEDPSSMHTSGSENEGIAKPGRDTCFADRLPQIWYDLLLKAYNRFIINWLAKMNRSIVDF